MPIKFALFIEFCRNLIKRSIQIGQNTCNRRNGIHFPIRQRQCAGFYTIFNIISSEEADSIEFELGPTLRNRGKILSIDQKEEKAWEIWIRDEHDNENFVYYLFNYDDAVIEINE